MAVLQLAGSRTVLVACCDADAAWRRSGVTTGESGESPMRTGRRYLNDAATETAPLESDPVDPRL